VAKTIVKKPPVCVFMPSSLAFASGPASLAGATKAPSGLVACDYSEARASAHQVLQFLDRMKNGVDDREGE
jgi:hypothetical protein